MSANGANLDEPSANFSFEDHEIESLDLIYKKKWTSPESNRRPFTCEANALPTAPHAHRFGEIKCCTSYIEHFCAPNESLGK